MLSLFTTHFFWLAVGASALNSATLAVAAGFAAKTDGGSLLVTVLLLTVGSHLLSFLYFLSGKDIEAMVHRYVGKHHAQHDSARFDRVRGYIEKYGTLYLFMYRFIPGLRFISPYIIGMSSNQTMRFFVIDWFAALLWAVPFSVVGYLFGAGAMRVIDDFSAYATKIFVGIFVVVVILAIVRTLFRRLRHSR